MNGVERSGVKNHHFSQEEEEALRKDESSSGIVKKDAKTNVELYGTDRSWREEKEHQQRGAEVHAALAAQHAASFGIEGLELGEIGGGVAGAVETAPGFGSLGALGAAGVIGGALLGLGLGVYELGDAHVKADEQARALQKDSAHVALIGALDLPSGYKSARFDGAYKDVERGPNSTSHKMCEQIVGDKKGLATLQMHADRGMNAAQSGSTAEAFFKANPKVAESYKKDAAFREGFDAWLYTNAKGTSAEKDEMARKLNERNGWYGQSQINVRG